MRVVLCLLGQSRDELWDRLSRRNATLPAGVSGTFRITEPALDQAIRLFEHSTA